MKEVCGKRHRSSFTILYKTSSGSSTVTTSRDLAEQRKFSKLEPLSKRLTLLGFTAVECNGHDFASLDQGKLLLDQSSQPGILICSTIKGKDWKPHENTVDSHYLPMKDETV